MAAMSKLAAMRISKPVELDKAEDTVTKLMRGLFGNLLTIAGSGVRPLSMVWQLFGTNPLYDLPTSSALATPTIPRKSRKIPRQSRHQGGD